MKKIITLKDILLTTTETLDGWEINKYLGPITTNVVVGTGLFSDVATSFSDIFGGSSKSYQNQLIKLTNQAIHNLKLKALSLQANVILGLKIDHDEISGKAKQMFMVTVYGTAAIAEKKVETDSNTELLSTVSVEELFIENDKNFYLSKIKDKSLEINDSLLHFIHSNKTFELLDYIFNSIENIYADGRESLGNNDNLLNKYLEFFSTFENEEIIPYIYDSLNKRRNSFRFYNNLIKKENLLDLEKIKTMLISKDFFLQRKAITLLRHDKVSYTKTDLDKFEEIITIINNTFSLKASIIDKDKMLSSKKVQIWICLCGKENEINNESCSKCGKDIYGFEKGEPNPPQIVNFLQEKISIIKVLLNKKL